jgi:integrase
MARTVVDTNLDTRAARGRLKARTKPYFRSVEPGLLHLGYRKPLAGAGKWLARHYVGQQTYEVETIAVADDYSDADGVAVVSYRQALAKARERMVARAHHAAGKHGLLTVRDAVEAHLEFIAAHRKSGYDAHQRARTSILPQLGGVEVEKLTTEQIRRWHAALAHTPARIRSPKGVKQRYKLGKDAESIRRRQASANRTLTQLKAALNMAWRDGRTPSDAAWRRARPFEGVGRARTQFLKVEECQRLINASTPEFRRLVQAALLTGCRYGELCRLMVSDFNDGAGTLAIRTNKANKPRHVVLTDEGVDLFRELAAGRAGNSPLLARDNGGPWGACHQGRPMMTACEHARIEPPIPFHGLRHTWASLSVMEGMPLMVVAKNLGHADTKMVEAHYGHLAPTYISEAIRAAAPRFGIKPSQKVVPISR